MADGTSEYRELPVAEAQPSRGARFVAAGSLWLFWSLSVIPIVILVREFGGQLGACGADEWWYHATSYPHFFIYPVTFGLAATVFLHRPWIQVVHYICTLRKPAKTRFWVIVVSMLVVAVFITFVEYQRAPQGSAEANCPSAKFTEATRSLWDIAPDAIRGEGGKRVRELVAKRCRDRSEDLEPYERCEFGMEMAELWKAGGGRMTPTVKAYWVGFIFMTILFVFLFAAIAIVRSWPSKDKSGPEGKRIAGMLLLALSFAAGWVVLRILYHLEKQSLYPEDPEWAFEILVFGIFVVFFIHGAASLWSRIERHGKNLIFIVLSIVLGACGAVQGSGHSSIKDFLVEGGLIIIFAWFLLNFASAFPFVLKKVHSPLAVVMVLVALLRALLYGAFGSGDDEA